MDNQTLQRITFTSVLSLSVSLLLYFASPLLIPLSYGLLIAFILYPICNWMEQHKLPRILAASISLLIIVLFFVLLVWLLFFQLRNFFKDWEVLRSEIHIALQQVKDYVQQRFNIPQEIVDTIISEQLKLGTGRFFSGIGASVVQIGSNIVMIFIIPVFAFLFLITRSKLIKSIQLLFPKIAEESIRSMLKKVTHTYYGFIKGMLIVYIIVAILNSLGLWMLGVPHAVLFGCIASVLTFIPYVGIMVGALLPISVAWITYGSFWYPLGVVAVFGFVQYLEANIIFPYAVGNRLNLNTLVTLVAIFIGGVIWGVSGMILFVPFLAIIKLFTDQYPEWKALSNLLSDK